MSDDRVSHLIDTWTQAKTVGRDIPVGELCRDAPELSAAVAARIAELSTRDGAPDMTVRKDSSGEADPTGTVVKPSGSGVAAHDADTRTAFKGADTKRDTPGEQRQPPPPAPPGYAIESELGRGGMGVVYKARDLRLNRTVALKMALGGDRPDPQDLARFRVESEAVAAVDHPHVVRVFGSGEWSGRPYLVMEYLDGGSLAGRLRAVKRLDPRVAARTCERIARGVAAAHAVGIVHRDLKPGNVLLDAAGEPKVADFGLARRRGAADQGLTQTGAVMGTPAYMAPEQAQDAKFVGPAADIYAVGAVLYDCLTGRPPFPGGDPWSVLRRVIGELPDAPRKLAPSVPRDLELICLKCLEKDPRDRYPTADALAADLARWQAGETVSARPAGPVERAAKWARRRPAAAAAWGLGLLAGGLTLFAGTAGVLWWQAAAAAEREHRAQVAEEVARKGAEAARDRLTLAQYARSVDLSYREVGANDLPRARQLLDDTPADLRGWEWDYVRRLARGDAARVLDARAGRAHAVGYDPVGWRLVSAHQDGTARVWNREGAAVHVLKGHGDEVYDASFTPGGKRIVTASLDGTVKVWDAASGREAATLPVGAERSPLYAVAASPDGLAVAAGGKAGVLQRWRLKGPEREPDEPAGVGEITTVRYSPDGVWLAAGGKNGAVKVWRRGTNAPPVVLAASAPVAAAAFAPDGRLAVGSEDGLVRVWDPETGRAGVTFPAHAPGVAGVAFSADGGRLLTAGRDRAVGVWDAATGKPVRSFRGHEDAVWAVAAAPTGPGLVSAGLDGTVRVWDPDGPAEWRSWAVAAEEVTALAPAGGRLFVGSRDGTVVAVDLATGKTWPVIPGGSAARKPDDASGGTPKPKGRDAGDDAEVIALTVDGAKVRWVDAGGRAHAGTVAEKPTGAVTARPLFVDHVFRRRRYAAAFGPQQAAAVGGPTGRLAIHAGSAEKPEWEAGGLGNPVGAIGWSPDGGRLVVAGAPPDTDRAAAGEGGPVPVTLWDVAGRRKVADLRGHTGGVFAVAFSPDGRFVATASADRTARVWDAATGEERAVLRGHLFWVRAVCWSPDGRVVTGCADGTVKVWDPATGGELLTLAAPGGAATAVAFSGRTLFVGGGDGTVRAFDAGPKE